jgi:hypothetical protein
MVMEHWRPLLKARPGERFVRHHRHAVRASSHWTGVGGVLLIVLGIALSLTPGPGFAFVLVGAALLAARSLTLARRLDQMELRMRRLFPVRSRRRSGRR